MRARRGAAADERRDVLGLDADYLRRGLHAAKAQAAESQHGKMVTIHTDRRDELRKASGD